MPRPWVPSAGVSPATDGSRFWDDGALLPGDASGAAAQQSAPDSSSRTSSVNNPALGPTQGGWNSEVVLREELCRKAPELARSTGAYVPQGEDAAATKALGEQLAVLCTHPDSQRPMLKRVVPASRFKSDQELLCAHIEALDREAYADYDARMAVKDVDLSQVDTLLQQRTATSPQSDGLGLLPRGEVKQYLEEDEVWLVMHKWPPDLSQTNPRSREHLCLAAVIVLRQWAYTEGTMTKLQYIATARVYRRRGVARALLAHFLPGAALLELHSQNWQARGLYQKMGFHDIGLATADWRLYFRAPEGLPCTRETFDEHFPGAWPLPCSEKVKAILREVLCGVAEGGESLHDVKVTALQLVILKRLGLRESFFKTCTRHLPRDAVCKWFRALVDEARDEAAEKVRAASLAEQPPPVAAVVAAVATVAATAAEDPAEVARAAASAERVAAGPASAVEPPRKRPRLSEETRYMELPHESGRAACAVDYTDDDPPPSRDDRVSDCDDDEPPGPQAAAAAPEAAPGAATQGAAPAATAADAPLPAAAAAGETPAAAAAAAPPPRVAAKASAAAIAAPVQRAGRLLTATRRGRKPSAKSTVPQKHSGVTKKKR